MGRTKAPKPHIPTLAEIYADHPDLKDAPIVEVDADEANREWIRRVPPTEAAPPAQP